MKEKTYIFTREVKVWGVEAGDYYNPSYHMYNGGTEKLLQEGIIEEEILEEKTCTICNEKADNNCGHCGSNYCYKHYGTTVQTGNCCRSNEEDYDTNN